MAVYSAGLVLALAIALGIVSLVQGSINVKSMEEGSCRNIKFKPQKYINTTWLETTQLPYVLAGSKYHLYRLASNQFQTDIPEYKFYYDSCLGSHIDLAQERGQVYGFGSKVGSYAVKPVSHGVIDFIPDGMSDNSRHHITLTDNKSFVFFANCWEESNQRSWDVISTSPTLDAVTKRMIEKHAESLGFDTNQFVFLDYERCKPSDAKWAPQDMSTILYGRQSPQ